MVNTKDWLYTFLWLLDLKIVIIVCTPCLTFTVFKCYWGLCGFVITCLGPVRVFLPACMPTLYFIQILYWPCQHFGVEVYRWNPTIVSQRAKPLCTSSRTCYPMTNIILVILFCFWNLCKQNLETDFYSCID